MYIPEAFRVDDSERLHEFIQNNPFATLVSADGEEPVATHLPLVLDRTSGRILGHFAKANPHWRSFSNPRRALAIFHGPHGYVSPSAYVSRPNVPTWAYAVVHATGVAQLLSFEDSVEMLVAMVEAYDPRLAATHPESTERAYIETKARGIVAFEMKIEKLEGKFKVGQNKSDADRVSAGNALAASSDRMLRDLGEFYLNPPAC